MEEVYDVFIFDFKERKKLDEAFRRLKKEVGETGIFIGVLDEALHISTECKNIELARKICKELGGKAL